MAQMAMTPRTVNLHPHHAKAAVFTLTNCSRHSPEEGWPTGPALIFGRRTEQPPPTASTIIMAGTLLIIQRAGSRRLGTVAVQDALLRFTQRATVTMWHLFGWMIMHIHFLSKKPSPTSRLDRYPVLRHKRPMGTDRRITPHYPPLISCYQRRFSSPMRHHPNRDFQAVLCF